MGVDDLTEWICVNMPALQESAQRFRWLNRLTPALDEIRTGKDAELALRRRGLPVDILRESVPSRGDPSSLQAFRLERVRAAGDYRCPGPQPCARREGRDDQGREPRCDLHDRLMRYSAGPPA